MLYREKPPGPRELPADAVRPKPERADTIKPLSALSRAIPGMHARLHQSEAAGPKPVQDPLKPQFGGLTPNRVKTQTIRLPSKTAAEPKAAAKPTANASVGGFSLTPSIKLPSVGSFAPASAAKTKEAEPKRVQTFPSQSAPSGAYVVHVSSQQTEEDARASYQVLQQEYASVLSGRDSIIRRVELGQSGTWYRVHVGAFATFEQATALCNSLKDAGGQCSVQKDALARIRPEPDFAPMKVQTIPIRQEAPATETPQPRAGRKGAEPRRATVERPRSELTPAPRRTIVPAAAPATTRQPTAKVNGGLGSNGGRNPVQGRCAIEAGGTYNPATGAWRYSCYGETCTMRYNNCISRALAGRSS
jgi:hypothetical protein